MSPDPSSPICQVYNLVQGNIGAAERGLPFLEEEELIPSILNIAEGSPVLSVRG